MWSYDNFTKRVVRLIVNLGSVLGQNTTTDLTITLTIFERLKYLGNATFTSENHAQWILPMLIKTSSARKLENMAMDQVQVAPRL